MNFYKKFLVRRRMNRSCQFQSSSSSTLTDSEHDTVIIPKKTSSLSIAERDDRERKLGRLDFLRTIGVGSYGRVVLAFDREDEKYFAVKVLSISRVVQNRQTELVQREKEILTVVQHPFIIKLHWTHHSDQFLFMSLEFVPGGELFTYMKKRQFFDLQTSIFYIAEIVSVFEYLHSLSIVYRDLKPENILLDTEGHVKLVDFGFAKRILHKTQTTCGTPDYLSPEVLQGMGHGKPTDWWTLGILLFEMLTGGTPFNPDLNDHETHNRILKGRITWPRSIEDVPKSFIKKLLILNPDRRLGNGINGSREVKSQPIFSNIHWDRVLMRGLTPPIVPQIENFREASCFENCPEDWRSAPFASDKELDLFVDF